MYDPKKIIIKKRRIPKTRRRKIINSRRQRKRTRKIGKEYKVGRKKREERQLENGNREEE